MDKAEEAITEAKARGPGKRSGRSVRAPATSDERPGSPAARGAQRSVEPSTALNPVDGPARPPSSGFGLGHLRKLMGLSEDVDVDRLCEDAAVEIERLRAAHPARLPWSD